MDNSNKPELFEVLQQVIDLDEDEIKELAERNMILLRM